MRATICPICPIVIILDVASGELGPDLILNFTTQPYSFRYTYNVLLY